jgi:hypothetical protein
MNAPVAFRLLRRGSVVSGLIAMLFLILILQTSFQKQMTKAISVHELGRYTFAIAAAITKMKYEIGGFVAADDVWLALMRGGLSDRELELDLLGVSYPDNLRDGDLLQKALERARDAESMPPTNIPNERGFYSGLTGSDGQDAALVAYASLSFALFGFSLPALTFMYFLISAASLLMFVVGHGRNVAAMLGATLFLMALYLLASSDLIGIDLVDIKDPRFLSTLAGIPVLHLILYWMNENRALTTLDYLTIVGQSVVFSFVIQIRASTQWALIAIIVAWVMLVCVALRRRRLRLVDLLSYQARLSVFVPAMAIAIVAAGFIIVSAIAHPLYRTQGDILHHTMWHGILYSLQLHPEWETKYGPSVSHASGDAMPVMATKLAIERLPPEQRQQYLTLDGWPTRAALERFSQTLFFDLLFQNPKFVIETFFVIKPVLMFKQSVRFFGSLAGAISLREALMLAATFIVLIAVAAAERNVSAATSTFTAMAMAVALFAWIPNWLVALNPLVMADHFLWGLFAVCIMVFACGMGLISRCRRFSLLAKRHGG